MDAVGLVRALRRDAAGEVRDDTASRELYACDASLYRRLPAATLRAASETDLDVAVEACSRFGVPLTMRGAGTSLAGQAVGRGLVVDCGALNRIEVDAGARRARVGPGAVLDHLNGAAGAHGLMFGPDVATATRATLGGMIANNSAGARSVVHGLTADHVVALDVTLADGSRARLRRGGEVPAALSRAIPLSGAFTPPGLVRRVSGYALDALAGPDPDWPRLLCGSEGTLALTRGAELRLVEVPPARALGLVPFPTVDAALSAVPDLLATGPSAVELMDRELIDPANRPPAVRELLGAVVDAEALLMVEYAGAPEDVSRRLAALPAEARRLTGDPLQAAAWAVRRTGIARALKGVSGPGDPRPLAFIEDPAVPPDRLAEFARDVRRLLAEEGAPAVWYGHASVGCLHIRPLMDLRLPGSVDRMRRIAEGVADLVVAAGGSLSGEHGDGRLRSELLPRMYPPRTIAAFAALKDLFDPAGVLNPGILTSPEPLDEGLRLIESPPRRPRSTAISFAAEGGLARAGEACNGNGACRADLGAMCPSYQALRDERHSTRGRAVLMRAALEGRLPDGLADEGLHEALDLCLGCKACAAECPAQVDMARLKVEALAHRHATVEPTLGVRALADTHRLLAAGARAPRLARAAASLAGRLTGTRLPAPVRAWAPVLSGREGPVIVVMADTFTRFLEPDVGDAAVRVLEAAGARVEVVVPGCCGRPLLSQGFVERARRQAAGTIDRLLPHAGAGHPIVVLEPSCWSMLADDAPRLFADASAARAVAGALTTLEGAVAGLGGGPFATPPDRRTLVHEHCHARALGAGDGASALAGITGEACDASGAGCCGMAGAFGHLHPELSRAIGEQRLAPAVREADLVVAAGTSCREQVRRLTGRTAVHPAQYLAALLEDAT